MRIGVIGWYGHQNAGDDRILHAIQRLFTGHELFLATRVEAVGSALPELNRCDFVLFGGGGLILRRGGQYAHAFTAIKPPFACIGISVEAVHPDNQAFIDVLREKSVFIHVRDQESAAVFQAPEKVISGADLTFLYPFDIADVQSAEICGVNLRAWRYWAGEHDSVFDRCMRKMQRRCPSIRHWYPFKKWEPAETAAALRRQFTDVVPISFYEEPKHVSDAEEMRANFSGPVEEFSPEVFARCRYLVGMRLHALIFACQMGIPFVSLSYQPKNAAFCRMAGVPELSVDLYQARQLPPAIEYLKSQYAPLRERLLDYRSQAHAILLDNAAAIKRAMGCR
ncbi:MAG: polysaccharide pyruvyl transferase family protein [Armatimonadota bacterium]